MKKIYYILSFTLVSFLFMGCPYDSETPIDKTPSVKIDKNLIGVWGPESTSDSTKYTVSKDDDFTYSIKKESTSSNETTITKYKGYLSEIGGEKFFNIWEDNNSDSRKYYFYKLEWADDNKKFIMHEVTDNITETFTSSDDLRKFIQTNMKLSFFFNKDKNTYVKK
jgi:hypothetical protein